MADAQLQVADLTGALQVPRTLTVGEVEALASELVADRGRFAPLFVCSGQRRWAEVYLRGLLSADVTRKNIEAMASRLVGAELGAERRAHGLSQFIGNCGWDDEALLDAHQQLVDPTLGEDEAVPVIDTSAIPGGGVIPPA